MRFDIYKAHATVLLFSKAVKNMRVNFNLHSIEARRLNHPKGPVHISNNSTLTAVGEVGGRLSVSFTFTANYSPEIGHIKIEGEAQFPEPKENVKKALDEWLNSGRKNLPNDIAEKVHGAILSNCIIEATILSREVQLPAPIPTPNIKLDNVTDTIGEDDTNIYIR